MARRKLTFVKSSESPGQYRVVVGPRLLLLGLNAQFVELTAPQILNIYRTLQTGFHTQPSANIPMFSSPQRTFSTIPRPSLSTRSMIGWTMSMEYGAWTPVLLITPSSKSCVAMPHGIPTVRAMAEYPVPVGSPCSSSVEVIVS